MKLPMPIAIQNTQPDVSFQSHSVPRSELAASTHPTRLAARLDPELSAATVVQLQKCARLQPRLAELLLGNDMDWNRIGWGPDLLRGHDPRRAALLAGSIWHARSLLKVVSQRDLARLVERIGADAHAFGIRHLAHAIADKLISDPEKLALQIEHDGHACLGAWLNIRPALERNRVLLRLPLGTAAENPAPEHDGASSGLFSLVIAHFEMESP
ncbi:MULTISPECIES: nodulation protein NolU [Sinorhizobium/Ensifer group]|uniref:Nodulation protein NolU n=4 Tax=Rhizobium fredii TaxID=380 RepID=NOLU_RHIFR|nr:MULTISPECIES: nodulation protein NolU [Sinorhizobium]P33210.1 RecName: Full=Nodulation protein NolU [Sinorhizobium fredii]MCK3781102.1 nodulation protein NolU [Ensifer sesbaniae]AAB17678.1 nodulation protein [Sinorhizobium fredii]AAU85367.1 nodulation protein [Sinorhizobium fredii HH103]MQW99086.1 nodulation protein NolU [Sinorhizobium fredii]MQX06908.1 nodulation protein NolU [Sinorhizobium fredii]